MQNTRTFTWFFRIIFVIVFAIIFARLAELQIIKGAYFRDLAEGNRIRRVPIAAKRGEIHSHAGEILVGNKEVVKELHFSEKEGFLKVDKTADSQQDTLISEWQREYKLGEKFAHVSGYVNEAREDEVGKVNPNCPEKGVHKLGSLIGRTGLEEAFDCELSGVDGEDLYEVDSRGKLVRKLGTKPPIDGKNIITNINFGLQEKVAKAMEGKRGGIVVSDAKGEILALFSSPSYDTNLFVNPGQSRELGKLFVSEDKPFFNRVIGGLFHPGSVFKPVVAVAVLSEDKIDKDFTYTDTGKIEVKTAFGDFSYSNWYLTQYGGVEGNITLARALARSTDTFFYKIGEYLGIDNLVSWTNKFGFGEKSGLDIPGQIGGLVPSPAWKREVRGESWFLGNTYHFSIGQGDLAVTPLSINRAIAALTAGELCETKIVGQGNCIDLGIRKSDLELVKDGMVQACDTGGTAVSFFDYDMPGDIACKTGTAETGINDKTHAWFVLIAPRKSQLPDKSDQIIMTVLVEEGGEGSKVAAPIAKEVLEYWTKVQNE